MDRFMPGFTSLNDEERWDVVGYALSLGLDPAAVARGEQVYADSCARCHGPDGRGGDIGTDVTSVAAQSGRSINAMYELIGRGSEPKMPGFAGTLSEEDRWAVATYLRRLWLQAGQTPPTPIFAATESTPLTEVAAGSTMTSETTATSDAATAVGTAAPTAESAVVVAQGQIFNGTSGSEAPADLEVTLHSFDGDVEVRTQTTLARAGSFAIEVEDPVPGRLYIASTEYGGSTYASQVGELGPESSVVSLPITVYETTADVSSVQVDRLHLLLTQPAENVLEVVELWILSNAGDRTVILAEDGSGLTGYLPEGSSQVRFDETNPGQRFRVGEGVFTDTQPLPPGSGAGEWVFSYVLAYDRRLELHRQTELPISSIVILVPDGMALDAGGLVDTGSREVQGESVHTYSLGGVAAGGGFDLTVSGRPRSTQAAIPGSAWALGVAALGAALLVAGWFWFRPRRGPRPAGTSSARDLLMAIAALDRDFEAGMLKEADYKGQRAALKRQALEAMRTDD
jgi:mono/diheme cytochrome c family protein